MRAAGSIIALIAAAFLTAPLAAETHELPGPTDPMPKDVTVSLTYEGAIYGNAKGMTLHYTRSDAEAGKSSCTDDKSLDAFHDGTLFYYKLPYPYEGVGRRSCVEKWPPFEPSADAQPVGKFSIIQRPDGKRQWAHNGRPLYTSIVDRFPGEVSEAVGTRRPLPAPVYLPAGLQIVKTVFGVTLADKTGKTLYSRATDTKDSSSCDTACVRQFPPVLAGAGGAANGRWSVIKRGDGQRQWAFDGKPLYTYAADEGLADVSGASVAGWSPVVLLAVPPPPEGIKIVVTPEGPVYVDRHGMSIYILTCHEENNDRLSCGREGDSAGIWHGLCGGPERCADNFKLIKVTDDTARKDDPMWSVRAVDLKNPLRILDDESKGTKVWQYNRRLVFTYGGDVEPGEIFGHGVRLQIVADVIFLRAYGAPPAP